MVENKIILEDVKMYCNVLFNDDDILIQSLIDTAKAYMYAKTSLTEEKLNTMQFNAYKSCICAIVFDLYTQRGATVGSNKATTTQKTNILIDELSIMITHFL